MCTRIGVPNGVFVEVDTMVGIRGLGGENVGLWGRGEGLGVGECGAHRRLRGATELGMNRSQNQSTEISRSGTQHREIVGIFRSLPVLC